MPSTDSLNNVIKKRIIIAIFSIIATVISAVIIATILPDKKDKKVQKMSGLTHFDSVSGVFSFDYPTFLEKIREQAGSGVVLFSRRPVHPSLCHRSARGGGRGQERPNLLGRVLFVRIPTNRGERRDHKSRPPTSEL